LNQQLTNLLKTDLETKITNPPVTNNKSVWPIIFGSLAIILITLGIIFLLINRFVKKIKAN
jgi:hypothetical protein